MIPLLLAASLALQDPTSAPRTWSYVDGVVSIVNEDIVTLRRWLALKKRFASEHPQEVDARLRLEILNHTVGSQAGETMGLDPQLVAREVRNWERRMIESRGGVDQYAGMLAQIEQTAEERRVEVQQQIYREYWEDSITGQGPTQQARVACDRFVRPGAVRLGYDRLAEHPRWVDRIGGTPPKVILQILEVDPARVGGSAQAEISSAKLHARVAAGADFAELVRDHGLPGSKAEPREPLDEAGLAEVDAALAKLVAQAREGELLPPVPPQGRVAQWRIVRLVKRIPAVIPGFDSCEIQRKVRGMIEDMNDGRRLEQARRAQFEGSYIWPSEPAK